MGEGVTGNDIASYGRQYRHEYENKIYCEIRGYKAPEEIAFIYHFSASLANISQIILPNPPNSVVVILKLDTGSP